MEKKSESVTIINMSELDILNAEVRNIFDESDPGFEHIIKVLGETFGSTATLQQVYDIYTTFKLPAKTVDGVDYVAGYRGNNRIKDGWITAKLIDVKQSGQSCKLMFAIGNKFLYHTLEEFTIDGVVAHTKNIGVYFLVLVASEKIEATGDFHAVIMAFKDCKVPFEIPVHDT